MNDSNFRMGENMDKFEKQSLLYFSVAFALIFLAGLGIGLLLAHL